MAVQIVDQLGAYLHYWAPYVILSWGTALTPVNIAGWHGNIFETVYGNLYPANIHPVGKDFGSIYRYGQPDPVKDVNPYTAEDLYSFEFLGTMYATPLQIAYNNPYGYAPFAAMNYTVSSSAGVMPNGYPYNGTVITFNFLPGMVWQDGAPFTAIDLNFSIWYYDLGGFSSNPYNPSQGTVTYAPGIVFNYTAVASNPSFDFFGGAPGLVGTYVPPNDPYQITIYFNTTSIFNLNNVYGIPILP
ncbi:hypothetical protein B9Q04_10735, partial [Candidatus Marsarchaeota G2 archaeon BE_D]